MRVGVTEIGWDGTIRRRALDTWCLPGADRWEHVIGQVFALPLAYQATPGRQVYIVHTSERAVLIGEEGLTGPLRDLVMTILIWPDNDAQYRSTMRTSEHRSASSEGICPGRQHSRRCLRISRLSCRIQP